MVNVPLEWWTLLVASVLPAVVSLVRARFGSSQVGALLLLGLTVLTSAVAEVVVEGGFASFDLADFGEQFVLLYIPAIALHFGLLKPAGVTGSQGVIAKAVPGGIGGSSGAVVGP